MALPDFLILVSRHHPEIFCIFVTEFVSLMIEKHPRNAWLLSKL